MPKDMSSVRYSRLLKIIALFQSKKKVSRKELELIGEYNIKNNVEEYHQNRTLQNDLDFLRDQGADIEYNKKEKLYVLKNDEAFIINIKVTKCEIEALSAGLKMVSHFLPHLNSEAHSLWEKLRIYVPHNLTKIGDTLATSTVIAIPVAPVKPDVFSILIEAKYKKSAVNIRYLSPNKEPRYWTLSPYDFYFRGNAWYMISFNHRHKALSIHRISRITKAEFSSNKYVPAEGGGFSDDFTSTAWHITPGREKHFFKVQLFENLANSMLEIKWHPTQKTEKLPDGSVILSAEVPNLDEVAKWCLAGAPNIRIIEPEELKAKVKEFVMPLIQD